MLWTVTGNARARTASQSGALLSLALVRLGHAVRGGAHGHRSAVQLSRTRRCTTVARCLAVSDGHGHDRLGEHGCGPAIDPDAALGWLIACRRWSGPSLLAAVLARRPPADG